MKLELAVVAKEMSFELFTGRTRHLLWKQMPGFVGSGLAYEPRNVADGLSYVAGWVSSVVGCYEKMYFCVEFYKT